MTLVDFILQAKISGYATGGGRQELKFDDGSIGFKFKTDEFKYVDRYYGFNPFSGTEHVYDKDETLIWKMNYYGEILDSLSDARIIYAFLRKAMSLITPQYPFRGPAKLKDGNFIYENEQHGTLDVFYGIETIHDSDKRIYQLYYHGGIMKKHS